MATKKILVGLSGGIDSSVVAALLKMQGYEVIGVHFSLWESPKDDAILRHPQGGCTKKNNIDALKKLCHQLEIPLHIVNARELFQYHVLDYLVQEHLQGRKPSPCTRCHSKVKFSELIKKANELKCDLVATGHYAKIVKNPDATECNLYKAVDKKRDQSHLLFMLSQNELQKTILPLGDLVQSHVIKMARTFGIDVPYDSNIELQTELCFSAPDEYQDLVLKRSTDRYRYAGPIVTQEGKILGRHIGLYRYVVGSDQEIKIDKYDQDQEKMFVIGFDLKLNALIIGPEAELMKKAALITNCNWIGIQDFSRGLKVKARYSFNQEEEAECSISLLNNNSLLVDFNDLQRGLSIGQPVVLYQEELVLGGGWIENFTVPVHTKMRKTPGAFSV